jgi:NAD kinase
VIQRLTENKIVLIVRRTRLDELVARFNTADQARFYVEHLGADFSDYQREAQTYQAAVQEAERLLAGFGRLQLVDRAYVPNFIFGEQDLVIALGQDGLVANVLKYLNRQRLIGVNPDPKRWEGVLLPFTVPDLAKILPDVLADKRPVRQVTMAQATLNTGQILYGVNDLFIGPRSHTSARYRLESEHGTENQSSSGIIVSTGLGSTGWFRSIVAGATGIAAQLGGTQPTDQPPSSFEWDADYLYFSVREPWPSKTSMANIIFGKITPQTPLTIISQMAENGVIFSDGIEADYLQFNSGTRLTVSVADKKGQLVV